jgi:phospholipid/cholesterol/gamma-HCH transport system ATP-binding protein
MRSCFSTPPGLDAIAADAFDALKALHTSLGVTVFLVTHDLDTLFTIRNASPYWSTRKIRIGIVEQLLHNDHP